MKFETDINGRFKCPTCTSSYKQKGHLVRHIKYECGVEPQFMCDICFRRFKHKSNLKAHYGICHKRGGSDSGDECRGVMKMTINLDHFFE
ncbi:unnamed protein product [Acanthoscelides obtectus]|uniref:C2H2-type domain-containing protein n=1 Tax=Acanthoscelides obtectus TaxID=200917 RepID=A0A9P0K5X3_ACAOB|nr:unnamed protein product [Acanthoscelides obtectus]CAK1669736.1 Longitudinals lacking protein, isoforms A/B/D/L [Acanthoscelides obtectus]